MNPSALSQDQGSLPQNDPQQHPQADDMLQPGPGPDGVPPQQPADLGEHLWTEPMWGHLGGPPVPLGALVRGLVNDLQEKFAEIGEKCVGISKNSARCRPHIQFSHIVDRAVEPQRTLFFHDFS